MRILSACSCAALLLLAGAGCRRGAKPDLGEDRTVEAGIPVELGSDGFGSSTLLWDTGEGRPPVEAEKLDHAFQKPGVYTVRALEGTAEVARVKLTVVPRPALRAIPGNAELVLFVPSLRGNVDALVNFTETLLGADNAQRVFQQLPLAPLILEAAAAGQQGRGPVDPEEGMGLVQLPGFPGTVGFVGVQDEAASIAAVLDGAKDAGLSARQGEAGVRFLESPDGRLFALFTDRGYLYAALPEAGVSRASFPASAARVHAAVAQSKPEGISTHPRLAELREKAGPGNLYVFSPGTPGHAIEGVWAALQVQEGGLTLDGFVATRGPLLESARGPVPTLLNQVPEGPVLALQVSLPPRELGELVFGAKGSSRRSEWEAKMKQAGGRAEELLGALRGDLALLAYFDAPAFFANLVRGSGRPEPRGTVLLEAGISKQAPIDTFVREQLEAGPSRVEAVRERGAVRYRTRLFEQPVEVSVTPDKVSLSAGELVRNRPSGDLAAGLRERSEGMAFTPGQVSLLLDFGRLRQEIDAPKQLPGVPAERLSAVQAFAGAFLEQLTPFDHAFFNVSPEGSGARLKGRLVLRGR